eukprot:3935177-Rhodomonas_salina.5
MQLTKSVRGQDCQADGRPDDAVVGGDGRRGVVRPRDARIGGQGVFLEALRCRKRVVLAWLTSGGPGVRGEGRGQRADHHRGVREPAGRVDPAARAQRVYARRDGARDARCHVRRQARPREQRGPTRPPSPSRCVRTRDLSDGVLDGCRVPEGCWEGSVVEVCRFLPVCMRSSTSSA